MTLKSQRHIDSNKNVVTQSLFTKLNSCSCNFNHLLSGAGLSASPGRGVKWREMSSLEFSLPKYPKVVRSFFSGNRTWRCLHY